MRNVAIIINAAARSGQAGDWIDRLAADCRGNGLDADIQLASGEAEIIAATRRAMASAPSAIVAAGGDGTIAAVASEVAASGIPLGILPLGTFNHFAKDLGVPLPLAEAVRAIAGGHTALVDIARVNGRCFLNNSSIGLYPQIVRGRDQLQTRLGHGKWRAFLRATLTALRLLPMLRVRVSIDGEELRAATAFVFVGNNEYIMEGFRIGVRPRLDGGQLSVYLPRRLGRVGLLTLVLRALFHRLRQAKDFEIRTAREVLIETHQHRVHVATDGEVCELNTPLKYRIVPAALRVLVPAPAE